MQPRRRRPSCTCSLNLHTNPFEQVCLSVAHLSQTPSNSTLKRRTQLYNKTSLLPISLCCDRTAGSSCFGGKGVGLALLAEVIAGVFGVDLEEVVEDNQKDGCTSEEDRKGVELGVGDHRCAFGVLLFVDGIGRLAIYVNL
jgi:hypothetical protein